MKCTYQWSIMAGLILLAATVSAMPPVGYDPPNDNQGREWDNETYINANNILMFVTNHGNFGRDLVGVFGYDAGTFYPYVSNSEIENGSLTNYVLYAAGLWVGGKVNGEIRVSIAEYSDEYVPGPMAGGTYQPDNPAFRVYKLYSDSLASNPNSDYLNWPVDQGAPVDNMGNPLMLGDQMLWTVFNDANPDQHNNDAGETDPLGIEIQQTVWASAEGILDSMVVSETAFGDHTGPSSGQVRITVVDPSALTGHDYAVVFEGAVPDEVVWHVLDLTIDEIVLANQTNQSGEGDYPVVDGLRVRVMDTDGAEGVEQILEIANGSGPLDPPVDVMWSPNSTSDWRVGSDQNNNFDRMNWRGHIGQSDWEIRFTSSGSQFYDWDSDQLWPSMAPFEVWNIGVGTPESSFDDQRIFFSTLDDDDNGSWSWGDRTYPWEQPYYEPAPDWPEFDWDIDFKIGRIRFEDLTGALTTPAEGTIVRFITDKLIPNTPADSFFFAAPDFTVVTSEIGGQEIYLAYKMYNKGGNIIEDAYISLWTDLDLGEYTDDLIGCDTLDNLFFCYNSDNDDAGHYNDTPPAIGFKVLKGPIVPGNPGDTADFEGSLMPGFRNLPMTAFQKYINGTDPNDLNETYNYMQGLRANGAPYIYDGNVLSYMNSGDPVTGLGDLDYDPSDRRGMASFGPITMMPGDSQYVLIRMAVGQGTNRLTSITELRELLNRPMTPPPPPDGLMATVEPGPISMMMLNALEPIEAVVTFGYSDDGPVNEEIDFGSLVAGNLPPIDSVVVLPDWPGFDGTVARFYFPLADLLTPHQPLWDSVEHPYTVSGQYDDGQPFTYETAVTIYGHRSGDLNLDGQVDISDLVFMVDYFFAGGSAPELLATADLDQSGACDITDLMLMIEIMFGQ